MYRYILFATILVSCSVTAQNITKSTLLSQPDFSYAEIAWHDNEVTCVLTDQGVLNGDFKHKVLFYTSDGKLKDNEVKLVTRYSAQHEMNFTVGKTLFFLEPQKNETAWIRLSGNAVRYNHGQVNKEVFNVFSIRREPEYEKLRAESYKFNAYKGTGARRTLLTYNNDYKSEYKEGFVFRTIDENLGLSVPDTLVLPFNDPECNIRSVIYDDVNEEIILLCELFVINGNNREYKNNFVYKYSIRSQTGAIMSDQITGFEKRKVLAFADHDEVIYGGLETPSKKTEGMSYTIFRISRLDGKVTEQLNASLSAENTRKFLSIYNQRAEDMLRALKLLKQTNGSIHLFWQYAAKLDDVSGDNQLAIFLPIAGGVIGGGIAMAVNVAKTNMGSTMACGMIWLKVEDKKVKEEVLIDSLDTYDLNKHGFYPLLIKDQVRLMYNRPTEQTLVFTQPAIFFETEKGIELDTVFKSTLRTLDINTVFGMSHFSNETGHYFLSGFNPLTDPYGTEPNRKVAFYLLKMQE